MFTAIGVILPSGPGYIGTFQYFTILALTIFSVPKEQALSYAVVAHASQWAPVDLLGLVYVWSMGLKLSDLFGRKVRTSRTSPSGSETSYRL